MRARTVTRGLEKSRGGGTLNKGDAQKKKNHDGECEEKEERYRRGGAVGERFKKRNPQRSANEKAWAG